MNSLPLKVSYFFYDVEFSGCEDCSVTPHQIQYHLVFKSLLAFTYKGMQHNETTQPDARVN